MMAPGSENVNTRLVYRRELFFKAIAYVLVCLAMGLASTYLLKSRVISIVLLILLVLPIFFIRMLLNLFTKKALIELYADRYVIKIFNRDGSQAESETRLNDILSYSVQFPTDNMNDIRFRLKNGATPYYSFIQKRKADEDTDSEKLINSFHSLIRNHNQQVSAENKIVFLPSFYASTIGLVIISSLSGLLIVTILIVSLFKGASSIPFTFIFTVMIIFQLITKRKRELDYYEKMKPSDGAF